MDVRRHFSLFVQFNCVLCLSFLYVCTLPSIEHWIFRKLETTQKSCLQLWRLCNVNFRTQRLITKARKLIWSTELPAHNIKFSSRVLYSLLPGANCIVELKCLLTVASSTCLCFIRLIVFIRATYEHGKRVNFAKPWRLSTMSTMCECWDREKALRDEWYTGSSAQKTVLSLGRLF